MSGTAGAEVRESAATGLVDPVAEDRYHRRFSWALIALVGGLIWLRPITSSLWVDELGTWWVIKDSFGDAVDRAIQYQGQSPVFYAIEWITARAGHSEWILRMPSLAAAAFAGFLMYRLGKRLLDAELGRLALLAFVAWPGIAFEASNARPYALALLATVASVTALVRWLDDDRAGLAVVWVVCGALVMYAHYLFPLALVPQLVYALVRIREGSTSVRARSLWLAVGAIALLDVPLIPQILSLAGRRGSLSIPGSVSVPWLTDLLVPAAALGAIVLGGALAWLASSVHIEALRVRRSTVVLALAWTVIPPLMLGAVSLFTPVRFVTLRYTLSAAPGACLLFAGAVRALEPSSARRLVVLVFALLSVLTQTASLKALEDWRWASGQVASMSDARTAVFMHPGLVESAQLDWFADPERRSYLLSPTSYYSFPEHVLPVPYDISADGERFMQDELDALPPGTDRIVYVTRFPGVPYVTWLDGRLEPEGWTKGRVESRGAMQLVEFVRDGTTP
jgi:4-amino-4-deoxy-L-arabinose transferase-like glycosyltransferase